MTGPPQPIRAVRRLANQAAPLDMESCRRVCTAHPSSRSRTPKADNHNQTLLNTNKVWAAVKTGYPNLSTKVSKMLLPLISTSCVQLRASNEH